MKLEEITKTDLYIGICTGCKHEEKNWKTEPCKSCKITGFEQKKYGKDKDD